MNILSLQKRFHIGLVSIAAISFFFFGSLANANSSKATDPTKVNKVNQCSEQDRLDNLACARKPSENEKDQCLKTATEKFRVCLEKP